ncbi:MAG: tetratricopeptide repeat protein [Candidatus Omnitrophica bacterium]|nr:tetratricopeptide repeat protein [Candidatus Omnitrophota bacterium]
MAMVAEAISMKHRWIPVAVLLAAVLGAYHNSVGGVLFWDDNETIVNNVYVQNPKYIEEVFRTSYHSGSGNLSPNYRPLTTLTFMVDYQLWKLKPFGYHLTNLLIHAMCVLLLFSLFKRITGDSRVACLAGLLFGVHPINSEAVNYVSNRTDLLMLFFFLLGFLSYIRFRLKGNRFYLALTALFYVFSLLSKEMGVVLPLFLILYDRAVHPNNRSSVVPETGSSGTDRSRVKKARQALAHRRKPPVVAYWIFGILFAIYALLRATVLNFHKLNLLTQGVQPRSYTDSLIMRVLVFAKGSLTYLKLFFWPVNLVVEYPTPSISSWHDPSGWLAAVVFGGFITLLFLAGRKRWVITFGAGWFLLGLLPVTGIVVPLKYPVSEHYLYLASAGIFLCASALLWGFIDNCRDKRIRTVTMAAAGIVLSVFVGLTFYRNEDWKSRLKLFQGVLARNDNSYMAHSHVAIHYYKESQWDKAQEHFEKADKLYPNYAITKSNLGCVAMAKENYVQAEKYFKEAIGLNKRYPDPRRNLADIYIRQGRYGEAMEQIQFLLKEFPEHPQGRWAAEAQRVVIERMRQAQELKGVSSEAK